MQRWNTCQPVHVFGPSGLGGDDRDPELTMNSLFPENSTCWVMNEMEYPASIKMDLSLIDYYNYYDL